METGDTQQRIKTALTNLNLKNSDIDRKIFQGLFSHSPNSDSNSTQKVNLSKHDNSSDDNYRFGDKSKLRLSKLIKYLSITDTEERASVKERLEDQDDSSLNLKGYTFVERLDKNKMIHFDFKNNPPFSSETDLQTDKV